MSGPQRFRKKPVEIEAMRWSGEVQDAHPIIQWILDNGHTAVWRQGGPVHIPGGRAIREEGIFIKTLEGEMHVSAHDWVIRGVQGEFYPCKPDIFAATYEAVIQ